MIKEKVSLKLAATKNKKLSGNQDKIVVKGARVHNLKNIDVEIPKNKLVVISGLSGSGKSSLAFDTIYAEGQRRYSESLSSYARQFMEVRDKPAVDRIDGLSPTIAIDQRVSVQNPRSTVGTVTEIYDYLRLLFARTGEQYCPNCNVKVKAHSMGAIAEEVRKVARKGGEVLALSPIIRGATVDKDALMEKVEKSGLEYVRLNGELCKINELAGKAFVKSRQYNVELMTGKIQDIKKQDPTKMVETALDLSNGLVAISGSHGDQFFSTHGLCPNCGKMMPTLDMRSFSFNSPYGACERCTGLGITKEVDPELVLPNKRLTLAEGAIQPWTRITGNQTWYQKTLAVVAERHHFSLDTPVMELPDRITSLLLYGNGDDTYDVDGKKTTFSGVIPNLMQRYSETTSEYVQKEIESYMREKICSVCEGKRLRRESLAVKVSGLTISEISSMSIEEIREVFDKLIGGKQSKSKTDADKKEGASSQIILTIGQEVLERLGNIEQVGLGYLSLDRQLNSLSGGEVTRLRLAHQLSTGLTGVIYILDEPSVGLHPKDNQKLIDTLYSLRDAGNSVIVVEHDSMMMEAADYLIDIGPGAGVTGGEVVAEGIVAAVKKSRDSISGAYLSGRVKIEPSIKREKTAKSDKSIAIVGAKAYNLKNINVKIPLGRLVCVTGVSGSGKSSLVIDILGKALSQHFYKAKDEPAAHERIDGVNNIDKVIAIDQSPIGRTPRSNPATYTGVFTIIRDLFAALPEARMRSFDAGKFSFNVKGGGRCEACAGEGYIRIPMQFLADVFMECGECNGTRYNQEALEIHYHSKSIADVLNMTVDEAARFFADVPALFERLNVLLEVGLGYVELGQPATTLSGGEAQRVKLATELSRASTGRTLYILDEPTTGLHFEDIKHLLTVLYHLVEKGNTVVIIEHNIDVIRCADWVIDLGPGGGKHGGEVIAEGTPKDLAKNKKSWTGKYLT
ncbi:MAG: UvrABC system protein A [Candidatus Magasanikbacteria bacterium GW2011_GWA2_46_17]|uniref:UvrABC system protein A n=1 Tax=Candidatus Magasanikbacteria bacterium GW2011_GWA2_46_17 TaxID=1619042 RepID=A0A0G1P329_9BACT|nr:MAG: UvrABC system protein A [Candidatus Magasanikbacteria bacterium GW2011_GWA2_46_17]